MARRRSARSMRNTAHHLYADRDINAVREYMTGGIQWLKIMRVYQKNFKRKLKT